MNKNRCKQWRVWGWIALGDRHAPRAAASTSRRDIYPNALQMKLKERHAAPAARHLPLALAAMYGTPDDPFVLPETGLDINKIKMAAGPVHSDERGEQRGLYRRHCVHCHGTTGDGMGPTAAILNPYPRDYRRGLFKFKSTERPAMPTNADLVRILREGIMGTAMPSFDLLQDDEMLALVEYVKYLSIRGETEVALIDYVKTKWGNELSKQGPKLAEWTRELLVGGDENEILPRIVKNWDDAKIAGESHPDWDGEPPADGASGMGPSRRNWAANFSTALKANCIKCHGESELGDGQTGDYDDWNKIVADTTKDVAERRKNLSSADNKQTSEERSKESAVLANLTAVLEYDVLPPRTITPRNLRQGYYRFGRRPLDLFRRVHAGINGAPMPGVGPASPGAAGTLSPEDIWHLVDYVQSLPYESISQPFKVLRRRRAREFVIS